MPAKDLIQLRRGVASLWTSVNPVLAEAELGVETDTSKLKIGDGTTAWNALPYFAAGGGGGGASWGGITGTLSSQTDLQTALNGKQVAGSYAALIHTHVISDVIGLQTALDDLEDMIQNNLAGGSAASVYTVAQTIDGGNA